MNILLLVISTFCFAMSDVYSKKLGAEYGAFQLVWMRYAVPCLLLLLAVPKRGLRLSFKSQHPILQSLRGLAVLGSAIFFITALPLMNMADATAIFFLAPILIVILAFFFQKEHVSLKGWLGVAAGFAGAMIISPPQLSAGGLVILLPLASALCWAIAVLITKRLSDSDGGLVTLNWTFFIGLAAITLLAAAEPIPKVSLGWDELIMGMLVTAAQGISILCYRMGNVARLAPFSYSQLLWAAMLAWIFFSAPPAAPFYIGALLIVAGSYFCSHRPPKLAS